ncbi:Acyl-CoA:lysophosphatidylglycerol acyltransferase 1 [Microtus ochrogaster]|uniref:Acyl-CoA:lysophosphatidylglycerol acyltransferase 1 n=1 Tax=Microtus ochrogaster TaxID=79684 RepID=A0A8J6KSE8_MICOH|nr:Acyl-CoA:lysophosphatidylglycerol acyltransferase 1 [Microtus ochrogaster]
MAVTVEEAPWMGWVVAKALMRFAFMVANNLVAIPSYICYVIILQPLRVLDSKRFWYIEGLMYKWLLGMVASWGWYAGYTVQRPYLTQSSIHGAYLTQSSIHGAYLTQSSIHGTYCTQSSIHDAYLTQSSIHSAYLTQSSIHGAYRTQSSIYSTYLTQSSIHGAYRTQSRINSTYHTQSSIHGAYHTQSSIYSSLPHLRLCCDVPESEGGVDVPLGLSTLVVAQMMWLMDHIFKYTNFGVVSLIHGDFFIRQGRSYRDQQLLVLKKHLEHNYRSRDRKWIVLFPEGGFLRKRRETSQAFAKKNNLPFLTHVTLPRFGATSIILNALVARQENGSPAGGDAKGLECKSRGLQWIIDATIAYPNAEPIDIQTWILGYRKPTVTHVHYRSVL